MVNYKKRQKGDSVKKIIGIVCLCLVLGGSSPVFGMKSPPAETEAAAIDERLQELLHVKGPFDSENHAGAVTFLQTGEIVVLRVDGEQIALEKYTKEGHKIRSLSIPAPSDSPVFNRASGFLVEVDDGRIFTNNGDDAFEIDSDFSKFTALGPLGFMPMDFRTKGTTLISQSQIGFLTDLLKFSDYAISGNPMAFASNPWTMIRVHEMGLALPEGYTLDRIMGSDFGETSDSIYALVYAKATAGENSNEFYIIHLEKSHVEGKVFWERTAWIPIERLGDTWIPTLRVTANGFEIIEQSPSYPSGGVAHLHRLNLEGMKQETIEIPGDVRFYDADGDQSLVTSWTYDGSGSTVYLVNWDYAGTGSTQEALSQGRSQPLIRERSMNGKTLARFRDHAYGLLQRKDKETGIADYLAPLKTEESDVLLQIPLEDLLEKLDQQARNLEIFYGEDRIAIPISSLDCRAVLDKLPCKTDATIEIHLVRQGDHSVQWTASLFVVEQVDEMTKLVHRTRIQ